MQTLARALRSLSVVVAACAALTLAAIGMAAQPGGHPQDKIVVSGASGQLGGLVVRELLARGVPASNLILVSRTPEKLDEFKKMGASTRFGDFGKPESLTAAFAGGKKLLLISIGFGGGPRPEAHKHAIDAAVAAGIEVSWPGLQVRRIGDELSRSHPRSASTLGQATFDHSMGKGTAQLNNLKLEGDKVTFEEPLSIDGNQITITYSGTLAGDELKLTRVVGDFGCRADELLGSGK